MIRYTEDMLFWRRGEVAGMNLESLLRQDQKISQRIRIPEEDDSRGMRAAAALLAHSADSWFWIAGLALFWVLGPSAWRPLARTLLISVFVTAACVLLIKFVIRRPRPEGEWGSVYRSSDPHSFPSGHAARTALLAVITLCSGPLWVGLTLTIWAVLVDYARIALGVHYLSDILVGTGLGLLFGWAALLVLV